MTRDRVNRFAAKLFVLIALVWLVAVCGAVYEEYHATAAESNSGKLVMAEAYCVTKHDAEVMTHSVEDYGFDGYRASVLIPFVNCHDVRINRFDKYIVAVLKEHVFSAGDREFGLDIWEAELSDGSPVYICFSTFGEPV
jgi:hypothetical protein